MSAQCGDVGRAGRRAAAPAVAAVSACRGARRPHQGHGAARRQWAWGSWRQRAAAPGNTSVRVRLGTGSPLLPWSPPTGSRAGIIKGTALRGGKEVVTDERAAVGLEIMAASVPQLLRLLYPALYPVHDPAGDWGRPGADGPVRALSASEQGS